MAGTRLDASPDLAPSGEPGRSWSASLAFKPKPKGNSKQIVSFGKRCRACKRGRPSIVATKAEQKIEADLVKLFAPLAPPEPFTKPVVLIATYMLPLPGTKAALKAVEERGGYPCSCRGAAGTIPDLTQLTKMLEDVLEKAGWLVNDSLVQRHVTEKVYAEKPGYLVTLKALP